MPLFFLALARILTCSLSKEILKLFFPSHLMENFWPAVSSQLAFVKSTGRQVSQTLVIWSLRDCIDIILLITFCVIYATELLPITLLKGFYWFFICTQGPQTLFFIVLALLSLSLSLSLSLTLCLSLCLSLYLSFSPSLYLPPPSSLSAGVQTTKLT